jgi:hypothetical protein
MIKKILHTKRLSEACNLMCTTDQATQSATSEPSIKKYELLATVVFHLLAYMPYVQEELTDT